jgi:FMN phosphatase YigB (HAD superfamily)
MSVRWQVSLLNPQPGFLVTSDDLGADKPDVAFSEELLEHTGLTPEDTAYVGDRYENDILPAQQAGLRASSCVVARGASSTREHPNAKNADLRLDDLCGARVEWCKLRDTCGR